MKPRYTPKNPLLKAVDTYLSKPLNQGDNGLDDYHDMLFRMVGGLYADFYALTMAQSMYRIGMHEKHVTATMHIRSNPFGGSYTLSVGLELVAKFIRNWHFSKRHVDLLKQQKNPRGDSRMFDDDFAKYLYNAQMDLTIEVLKEGSLAFPYQSMVIVTGPAWMVEMVEGAILNLMNSHTLFATAASHLKNAIGNDLFIEGGLRRSQDFMGLGPTRSAMIAGANSSSNVASMAIHGTKAGGTMAHFYIMLHESEYQGLENYLKTMPDNSTCLPDTEGDTPRGVRRVIKACKALNIIPMAIRLDSGDLAYLAKEVRKILDAAGFTSTMVIASNDLDPESILSIKGELLQYSKDEGIQAKMNGWLVGTWLAAAKGDPALGGVYKLAVVYEDSDTVREIIKVGGDEHGAKTTIPGISRAIHILETNADWTDKYSANIIVDGNFDVSQKQLTEDLVSIDKDAPLNKPVVFKAGSRINSNYIKLFDTGIQKYELPPLEEVVQHAASETSMLDSSYKRWKNPRTFKVGIEKSLFDKRQGMIEARR